MKRRGGDAAWDLCFSRCCGAKTDVFSVKESSKDASRKAGALVRARPTLKLYCRIVPEVKCIIPLPEMGNKRKQLSQAEIWDDSALLQSWNEALAEYKVLQTLNHTHFLAETQYSSITVYMRAVSALKM